MISRPSANEKLDSALELAALGYPVFPCRTNSKKPANKHGLLEATTDEDAIVKAWEEFPDFNIGLRTDGLVVFDRDLYKGCTWPDDPDRELELSAAPTSATSRGGRHHFFRDPTGTLRNTESDIAQFLDTRACGGYVVVPPSIVGGKSYQWLNPLDCPRDQLSIPSDWVQQALFNGNGNGTRVAIEIPHTLETHQGATKGKRNAALCHLVGGYLATHGATAELPELALAWAARCDPPLPEPQVVKSVASLVAKHQAKTSKNQTAPAGTGWKLTRYSEVEPEPIQWLWKGRLPLGKLVILSGDPGLGKTTVLIDITARVSTGIAFPDGGACPRGTVLFYTLEDGLRDTMVPRLMAAGGDRERVIDAGPVTRPGKGEDIFQLDRDLPLLKAALEQIGDVLLVIIDPISGALGDSVNENRNSDIRRVLGPLMKLAEQCGACVLGNSHFGKAVDRKGVHRTIGSVGLIAAARAGWAIVADGEDEDRRLLLPQKNNLAKADGLAFRLRPTTVEGCDVAIVEWEAEPVTERLDDIDSGREAPAFDEACVWLRSKLTDPIPSARLIKEAKRDGISEKTLRRAKQSLGVQAKRHGNDKEWHWFPPPEIIVKDMATSKKMATTTGTVGHLLPESETFCF